MACMYLLLLLLCLSVNPSYMLNVLSMYTSEEGTEGPGGCVNFESPHYDTSDNLGTCMPH